MQQQQLTGDGHETCLKTHATGKVLQLARVRMKGGIVQLHVVVHILRFQIGGLLPCAVFVYHLLCLQQTIAGEQHRAWVRHPGIVLKTTPKGLQVKQGFVHIDERCNKNGKITIYTALQDL